MRPAGSDLDAQLAASLRRIAGALQQNRDQYASMVQQIMASAAAEAAERISARTEHATARIAEQHQRRVAEWQRREARRERRRQRRRESHDEAGDLPRGIVLAVVAIICATLAVRQPAFFWMIFVALGLGMSAATSFARAARRKRLEPEVGTQSGSAGEADRVAAKPAETAVVIPPPPPAASEPPDPKVVRIQMLCDKLLAELESGPPIVREVVTEPHATIGGLRQACLETARRERELRGVLAAQDEAGLVSERDALAARLSNEKDAIVRDRLGQALGALEQQLAHRAELGTAATRLEAENTRILYTLENLHMQLLRARSTDIGAPELGGRLRESLRELGTQIEAVAEALEYASSPVDSDTAANAVPESPAPREPVTVPADRERAEREAAARRAAQARQAQRQ